MRLTVLVLCWLCVVVARADALVFSNVQVVTLDGDRVLAGQDVLIEAGRITAVGPTGSMQAPDGARSIDAAGRYLVPGLAEMHAHIPPNRNRAYMAEVLFLYLSQGITTVRGMLGEPGHLQARADQQAGRLDAPRILAGGPSLNGNSVRSPQQGARLVEAQHRAGYDHLKIHPGLSRAEFDAIAERARELDMNFGGHVSSHYSARHAIGQGQATIEHLDGLVRALVPEGAPVLSEPPAFFGINLAADADPSRIETLARAMEAAGAWVVPTEALMVHRASPALRSDDLLRQPGMAYVSASSRADWRRSRESFINHPQYDAAVAAQWLDLRRKLIAAFDRHGQRVLLGSDAPQVLNVPGFSIHRELAIYVQAGLTPARALATGSINVARYLGIEDRRGRIAPGQDADLVLLAANPIANIDHTRRIEGVMVGGRWFDRASLDERLAAIAAAYAN